MPLTRTDRALLEAHGVDQVCSVHIPFSEQFDVQEFLRIREEVRNQAKVAEHQKNLQLKEEELSPPCGPSSEDSHALNVVQGRPSRPQNVPSPGCVSSPESFGSFEEDSGEIFTLDSNSIQIESSHPSTSSSTEDVRPIVPTNMEEVNKYNFPYYTLKCVNIDRVSEPFIIRAERGAVDWNFYNLNPREEQNRYNLYTKGLLGKAASYSPYRRMDDWFNPSGKQKATKKKSRKGKVVERVTEHEFFHDEDEEDDDECDKDFLASDEEESPRKGNKKGQSKKSTKVQPKFTKRIYICEHCSYMTTIKINLEKHNSNHITDVVGIECEICGVKSISDFAYKRHLYQCHEGPAQLDHLQSYTCKACEAEFNDLHDYECHLVNHVSPDENGFSCSINCHFVSSKYQTVVDHCKVSHVSFKCTFCPKSFSTLNQTERHSAQTHKELGRPFACSMCDFRSATYGILMDHREESHGIVNVKGREQCKFCDFQFDGNEHILAHLAIHTNFLLYKCRECDFRGKDTTVFGDHGVENHISFMIDGGELDLWLPPDIEGLQVELDKLIAKKFGVKSKSKGKSPIKESEGSSSREKPTPLETQSAVAALLDGSYEGEAIVTDNEVSLTEFEELMSSIPPLTASSLTMVDGGNMYNADDTLNQVIQDLTPLAPAKIAASSSRPKRTAFLNASQKINQDAVREQEAKKKAATKAAVDDLNLNYDPTQPLNGNNSSMSMGDMVPSTSHQSNAIMTQQDVFLGQPPATLADASLYNQTVYDPTHKHLYYNGNPIIDETGHPITVEQEDIPQLMALISSQSFMSTPAQAISAAISQPVTMMMPGGDASVIMDPTTGTYYQQMPMTYVPQVTDFVQPMIMETNPQTMPTTQMVEGGQSYVSMPVMPM